MELICLLLNTTLNKKKLLRLQVRPTEVRFGTNGKSALPLCISYNSCISALIKLKGETITAWFVRILEFRYNPQIPYFSALINCMLYILFQN